MNSKNIKYLIFIIFSFNCIAQNINLAKEYEKEIREMDSLVSADPSAMNYYYRGFLKYNKFHYQDALADYDKAIELDNSKSDYFFSRAMLNDKINKYNNSIEDYTNCINLPGTPKKAFFNRAYSKSMLKDFKGAIEDYYKSLEIDSLNKSAFLNIGIILKNQEKFKESITAFNKAIEIDSDFIDAIQNRAISKSMINDVSAINDFNQVIALDPKNGEAYLNRAYYFLNRTPKSKACADLIKAKQLGFNSVDDLITKYCN